MKCYEVFELEYQGSEPENSQVEVELYAEFICEDEKITIKGFYDGEGCYKIRFLPQRVGRYTWKVSGIVDDSGEAECENTSGSHGMVQAEGARFAYQDGMRYLPFGTTIYALAHQPKDRIEQTFCSLRKAPFNKLRHCVFPKHYDYNHEEPELYPFEKDAEGKWDIHRPCFAFWKKLEKIIIDLGDVGIESDLILFHPYDRWGFASFTMEESKIYLDYVLRRFSAIPCIWWSMANEYDLMFNRSMEDWYEIEKFIVDHDPYHHLISNHNCMKLYDFGRQEITHCCVQTNAMHKAEAWMKKYQKPVIFDECCYEGDIEPEWGNISGFEMVNRFWKACVKGAYVSHGETYYADDEVLWWSKGGMLKGKSPKRIGFLKEILYSLPSYIEPWTEIPFMESDFSESSQGAVENSIMNHPFAKLYMSLSAEEAENLQWKMDAYMGRCGDDVYIKYLGDHCPKISSINLPKDKKYRVEVIDVWEMTRAVLYEEASGSVRLDLPGKQGIAVLAEKVIS